MKKDFKRGFTLVELAVVILVLGVVLAFVLPAVANKTESSQATATAAVSGYIAEYESNHSTDHVDNVVVIHCEDKSTLYVFGYNFKEDVLYMFSGAQWLVQAQGNMLNTTFTHVASNIVTSANHDSNSLVQTENPYPDAEGLFSGSTNLKDEFSNRTQKKMNENTLFLSARINKSYTTSYGGIEYRVIRADGETGTDTAAATYTTVFRDSDNTTLYTYSTDHESVFTCPDDPTQSGKQFLYWELVNVNGVEKNVPGTALVPGEEYEVPNSNVEYKAVYGSATPEQKNGAYQLYGAKHLKWFADYVNDNHGGANAVICRSFKAESTTTAIGTRTYPYHGTFDGNGKTIMNLSMSASGSNHHTALFAYTNGAEIKDLTLSNPTISGTTYVAAVVAEAKATVDATGAYTTGATKITNCKITGANITCADVAAESGATAEQKEALAQQKIFKDRYEVQNVEQTVDYGEGPVTETVPTVVLSQAEQGTYCGGLVGFGENIEIKECSVSGTIAGGNNGVAVGGIMGAACGTHVKIGTSGSTKIGASTDATVSGVRYVGGLVGKTVESEQIAAIVPAVSVTTGVEIYNSYNAGKVARTNDVMQLPQSGYLTTSKSEYCIGFGGLVGGAKGYFLTITSCDTTKNAEINPVYESSHTGGILGYAEKGEISLNACINNAKKVSSRYSAGGIVGASRDVRLIVTSCENNGTVEARNMSAGGILGYAKTSQTNTRAAKVVQITDSENNAAVKAPKRAGGILGDAERTVTIRNSENKADVSETFKNLYELDDSTGCGGIVGYSVGKLVLSDCRNEGTISSSCEGVGGIVGKTASLTVDVITDVPTADEINGTTPATPVVPTQVTLSSTLSTITKCTNTGSVQNIARTGDVLEDPTPTPTPTGTPDPAATPEPTPLAPYKYSGGIIGFADEIVTIDYCINASYVTGNTNAGGIAGGLKYTAPAVEPDPLSTDPTVSSINHSISVGIVESVATTGGVAGAILGTNEWQASCILNVYLANMVQFTGTSTTEITQTAEATPADCGTRLAASKFTESGSGSAIAILNSDIVAPATPIYVLPESATVFAYPEMLTTAAGTYTVTLPTFLPIFAE